MTTSLPKLFLIACPEGRITKSIPRPSDGAPTIRLHASGTRKDLVNDKITEGLLESMMEQAKAGTVKLLENHHASFPFGYSFDAQIEDGPNGSKELFIEFWLDPLDETTKKVLRQIEAGYEAQCSIGLEGNNLRDVAYDPSEQGLVGFLSSGRFDHVAFTRPGEAAYPYAEVDGIAVAKSLEAAVEGIRKSFQHRTPNSAGKETKMKPEFKTKMDEATKAREAMKLKMKEAGHQKDDVQMALKTSIQHMKALKEMADGVMSDGDASPDDTRAMLQHIIDEGAMIADVLSQYVMGEDAEGEPPAVETKEAGSVPSDLHRMHLAEAARHTKEAEAAKVAGKHDEAAYHTKDAAYHTKEAEACKSSVPTGAPIPAADHSPAPKPEANPPVKEAEASKSGGPIGPPPEPPAGGTPATPGSGSAGGPGAATDGGAAGGGAAVVPHPEKPTTKEGDAVEMAMKSISAELTKVIDKQNEVIKSLTDRLKKVEALPDYSGAPARFNPSVDGDDVPPGLLGPTDLQTASMRGAAKAFENALRGRKS